jgi:hypothetical protein
LVALCLLAATAAEAQANTFRTGFGDPLFASSDSTVREEILGDAVSTRSSIAKIVVSWRNIAPSEPSAGFAPADPSASGYAWTGLDAAVRAASSHDLEVLFTVTGVPGWAEGPNRPKGVAPGTWEPDPASFEAFARALATRYSGNFPDSAGSTLPGVHLFEAWNEPNLSNYLNPQWDGERPASADIYRNLLNAFYNGVKTAQPRATVVGGALAPFGDPPGGERVPPVTFTRELFCLKGGALVKLSCPHPAHLDAFSDHPIAVGPPTQSATSPLDVTTPNLGRLTTILQKAEKTHRALPTGKKPLWVTEFWYDSNPPDPTGVPVDTQARWYEQDLYLFWKQGAEAAIALQLRDAPEGKNYASTFQSGAYFVDGSAKPSATALRFPFVAHRTGPFKVGVWGIAPQAGRVRVQALRKGSWKTLGSVPAAGPARPFTGEVQLYRFAKLRAVIGKDASLPWAQR